MANKPPITPKKPVYNIPASLKVPTGRSASIRKTASQKIEETKQMYKDMNIQMTESPNAHKQMGNGTWQNTHLLPEDMCE